MLPGGFLCITQPPNAEHNLIGPYTYGMLAQYTTQQ